jgi:urease accessory protein
MSALPHSSNIWRAALDLRFERRQERTVLAHRRHNGPLLVQRPFDPGDGSCQVYLVHPPGGIAGGDELTLTAAASPGAQALITTPAATKFYRAAPGRISRVSQHLQLTGARLEWLPQESLYFRGASARTRTRVDLDRQSRFIGWEINCYGRPASAELFDAGTLCTAFELWCEGEPLLIDVQHHAGDAATREAPWCLAGHASSGCLLAYPATPDLLAAARCAVTAPGRVSASLVDEVLCCRAVGSQGETVRGLLTQVWVALSPQLMDRPARPPRIWAT